jgi:hypothetical protein
MQIEFLVEDESMAEALRYLVPKMVESTVQFDIHAFQGKPDLLKSLPARMRGYAHWQSGDLRIVVIVDRDNEDCRKLKKRLDDTATDAGFRMHAHARRKQSSRVLNRVAIEELEAWFFGDTDALREAYPRVPKSLSSKKPFRDPDAIKGGTWERLEKTLQDVGYYLNGLPKVEVAREVARRMEPARNRSRSFQVFREGLLALAK